MFGLFSCCLLLPGTMVFSEEPCLLETCLNRAEFLPDGLENLKLGRPVLSFGELGNRQIKMSQGYEVQAERSGERTAGGTSGGVVDSSGAPSRVGAQRWEGPGQECGWEGEALCPGQFWAQPGGEDGPFLHQEDPVVTLGCGCSIVRSWVRERPAGLRSAVCVATAAP